MKAHRTGKRNILALALLAVFATVGVGSAAIPSASDGVIHSCYQKPGLLANPGAVRVIDKDQGQSCRSTETALQWNQRGPTGATGPAGPAGADGADGADGATGPEGPVGPAGADAPSEVFFASNLEATAGSGGVINAVSKTVPPGKYTAEARLTLDNENSQRVGEFCSIHSEFGGIGPRGAFAVLAPEFEHGEAEQLELTAAFNHNGGEIEVECTGQPRVRAWAVTLIVTRVGAVNPSIPAG